MGLGPEAVRSVVTFACRMGRTLHMSTAWRHKFPCLSTQKAEERVVCTLLECAESCWWLVLVGSSDFRDAFCWSKSCRQKMGEIALMICEPPWAATCWFGIACVSWTPRLLSTAGVNVFSAGLPRLNTPCWSVSTPRWKSRSGRHTSRVGCKKEFSYKRLSKYWKQISEELVQCCPGARTTMIREGTLVRDLRGGLVLGPSNRTIGRPCGNHEQVHMLHRRLISSSQASSRDNVERNKACISMSSSCRENRRHLGKTFFDGGASCFSAAAVVSEHLELCCASFGVCSMWTSTAGQRHATRESSLSCGLEPDHGQPCRPSVCTCGPRGHAQSSRHWSDGNLIGRTQLDGHEIA